MKPTACQDFEQNWEALFQAKITQVATADDPAHDLAHFQRVVATAKLLAQKEQADVAVVIPAAWLHDLVSIAKNDPRRVQASKLSADAARKFLTEINYPADYFDKIAHAVEAHSYSAGLAAKSLEAKIVQDADRLDALGAIGIARCFAVAGVLRRPFYQTESAAKADPFCEQRTPDDSQYTLDHFFTKLLKLTDSMQTPSAKAEAELRTGFMRQFLEQLKHEIAL